jgi:hypothetical protein
MKTSYEKFDLVAVTRRARNYLISMVDPEYDFLPYWFVQINENPAFARHVRVDDAELVASWYEAIVSVRNILGRDAEMDRVEAGFKRHLRKSWGPAGLRYHEPYPWSNTNHASFHEMAYILSALNRWLGEEPGEREMEQRAADLVRGMRQLVVQRKIATFWSGDFPFDKPVYEFPGDVYLREGGFVTERVTGRGEEPIRNGMMLHALVVRAEKFKDEVALDLATGMANHLLGLSRYFNWRGEFFGHIHSAVWVASGLARLSRVANNPGYLQRANDIFSYVRSLSSEFGWVPEFAQWHPPGERFCETCCIKDMIECAFELIDNGGLDYWDLINRYTRNQLVENQIKDGCFIADDNSRPDAGGYTWKNISQRVVGGWSGGAEPNSISLTKFRSIAGCCIGTAPQALEQVWQRVVVADAEGVVVNFPIERDAPAARVEIGYPNTGQLRVTARKPGRYAIRAYDWMNGPLTTKINGQATPPVVQGGLVLFPAVKPGDVLTLEHPLASQAKHERVRDVDFTVTWRGADVVQLDPPGQPLRLYQRDETIPKEYPPPPKLGTTVGAVSMKPTEQKR